MAKILVVDDEPKMTSLICAELEDVGHQVITTVRPAEALSLLDKHNFDIVITDLSMPEITGHDILARALARDGTEVVIMTAYGTVESAVQAMKQGAADYLLKPFSLEELKLLVKRLIDVQKTVILKEHFEAEVRQKVGNAFIGESAAAQKVKKMIGQVGAKETTVLLTGSSGTGKELAARMIHELSPRRRSPFIAINCAALPETLLESELFGHERGAFTGAVGRKRGRFELAEKGTLFLDEIGDMPIFMQAKLLRVLEEKSLVRVGGIETVPTDVRLIAATNRNLKDRIKLGQFREDLYFRLNVFPIEMPELAERVEDIPLLSTFLLKEMRYQHTSLTPAVCELLQNYDWPGNVRELRNALERAVILSEGEPLSVDDFSLDTGGLSKQSGENALAQRPVGLEATERDLILAALSEAGWNKTDAARALKITRRRLYSRMKVHGITDR